MPIVLFISSHLEVAVSVVVVFYTGDAGSIMFEFCLTSSAFRFELSAAGAGRVIGLGLYLLRGGLTVSTRIGCKLLTLSFFSEEQREKKKFFFF